MGYAISINEAMPIIEELINTGYIVRPWLGIGLTSVNQMVASFYNLAVDSGALVTQVTSGSPADQAGLQAGDVITAVDDSEIGSVGDLTQIISSYDIGQQVTITYWRGQTKATTNLTLGESPPPGS
jgi:serine protease Do